MEQFEQRKRDHIQLALDTNNQAQGLTGFDSIKLIHEALPDCDFVTIQLNTERFGSPVNTPFYINSMTAGHHEGKAINQTLAKACQVTGWAMGVGSQRRELTCVAAAEEWVVLRQVAPDVTLYGNIGISQLIHTPLPMIQSLVDSLGATAMIVHTNPLQECLQPEGTPNFKGSLQALSQLCENLNVPVMLKETGCGMSPKTLTKLKGIGLAAVDVSGLGGTHWGRIEGARAPGNSLQQKAAQTFQNWGISTVDALWSALSLEPDYDIFASGGVRNGLDAAKCLALGAQAVGIAKPLLSAALEGEDAVIRCMQQFEYELRVALFCTGCQTLADLNDTHLL